MPPSAALGQDLPGWHWEQNHCFSSKLAYAAIDIDVSPAHDFNWKMVWSIKLPQRIQVVLWLAVHDRLLSNVERKRRHLTESDVCAFCNGKVETLLHVFSDCRMVQPAWRVVIKRDMLQVYCAMTYEDWLDLNLHGASEFACDSLATCWVEFFTMQNMVADRVVALCRDSLSSSMVFDSVPAALAELVRKEVVSF
ncbi:hypothetical protein V6N13_102291 [Hibiscus sabdariffa]